MLQNEVRYGVSVLICTYNGSQRLHRTLNAFNNQIDDNNIPWEVIVVDNASTDESFKTAGQFFKDKKINHQVLIESKPGKTNAIETGFNNAQYEFVCIVDDDNEVCRDYIARIFNIMLNHPEVAICGAKGEGVFEEKPPYWLNSIENAFGLGPQGSEEGYLIIGYLYGASSSIRKTCWKNLKSSGFEFTLSGRKGKSLSSGEDMELGFAFQLMGYKLWYSPAITFQHFMPASRINWPYAKKLFSAFGRSDVITNQYLIYLNWYGKIKRIIYLNYVLHVLYSVYRCIKYIPIRSIFYPRYKTYNNKILVFCREKAYLVELMRSGNTIKSVRAKIQKLNEFVSNKKTACSD